MSDYSLTTETIRQHLDTLAEQDAHMAAALELVGYPAARERGCDFATFLRVIVGQQLSVKAAATISGRVEALMDGNPTPDAVMRIDDESLRAAGLSRQKISYVRSLCDTVGDGTLDIAALPGMDDAEVIKAITAVKGLGVWSAHMFMMFSLGRPDIWPVGDLAVRVGIGRIVGLEDRPGEKEAEALGERWRPYRSSVALLSWHYYSNAPL
ncbi:DNA-3-methyladenine glycosylase family protein [Kordiimonas marina]|uniref:DNA-3-methyladenine glycosylase family protein n=1 Tax=Kordiimonas marina TaxID=2872312 RepID=UPI001FF381A9|nr:DNA-3-methyladenine glycosylase 2 family protein [Kordiimonas marina]MCJ9430567.1 DNA-3-methyladenine glycosylase 2 family protein [Kordiimonas marina]